MLYCQLNTVILSSKRSDMFLTSFFLHSLFLIFSQRKSRGPFKWWIFTTYQSRRTGTTSSARAVAEADSRQGTGDLHVQRPSYIQRTHKFVFYASRKRNLKGSSFFCLICTLAIQSTLSLWYCLATWCYAFASHKTEWNQNVIVPSVKYLFFSMGRLAKHKFVQCRMGAWSCSWIQSCTLIGFSFIQGK